MNHGSAPAGVNKRLMASADQSGNELREGDGDFHHQR